ncbi:MAG: nucleotidyl transferase AbiEii/AbiGii toxin family protein [Phycisphaerae bacterium]|nr:nucleotidyl transferase AbiEii/AbiGii toxin family protein [Phycisphaerae bacterium]
MKPLRIRLEQARQRTGMGWEVLERDYMLSWILVGISRHEQLCETLVFKGGTALKKCYFGDYRFSEDLDFSGLTGVPVGEDMETAIEGVCRTATELLDEYAPVRIEWERYTEREPHPAGQEAFTVRVQLPWQKQAQTRVMVEIAVDEKVLKPPCLRSVVHEYGEPIEADVQVYGLEEIVAEKLRAILQHRRMLEERGWSRSRARDYYDIWRILGAYQDRLDLTDFEGLVRAKCDLRRVDFRGPDDFFDDAMLAYVERTWSQWLGNLVPELPTFNKVIGQLRPQIAAILRNG